MIAEEEKERTSIRIGKEVWVKLPDVYCLSQWEKVCVLLKFWLMEYHDILVNQRLSSHWIVRLVMVKDEVQAAAPERSPCLDVQL